MHSLLDWIKTRSAAINARDPQLQEEDRLTRDRFESGGRLPGALETLEVAAPDQNFALETIVLRTKRPVLAIFHNSPKLELNETDSKVWKQRLEAAKKFLDTAIPAIGRVDLKNNDQYDWVGTAWLVDEDIVVTNRHVAQTFAHGNNGGFIFRTGFPGDMSASVDFLHEIDNSETRSTPVAKVLYIEPDSGPDVALLRLEGASRLGSPIPLADYDPKPEEFVSVIGYPASDSRIPEQDLMSRIFGDIYNVKRLAPGQLMKALSNQVQHDCSTLGGNSGSVVLSLRTGMAVGLHFSGTFLSANYAVPAALVQDRLRRTRSGTVNPSQAPTLTDRPVTNSPAAIRLGFTTSDEICATINVPLCISVRIGNALSHPPTSEPAASTASYTDDENISYEEGKVEDYSDRRGYDEAFLGKTDRVPLPVVNGADVLQLRQNDKNDPVLRYEHFSVVVNSARRMCIFSAVNLNGKLSRRMKRGPWKFDPRVDRAFQIMKECYGNPPKFSRGHMTRREDPIWGTETESSRGNLDSMHVTNVVPQMQAFNAGIWEGLENYALQHARGDEMLISVFTGPFFTDQDKSMFGVKIPIQFWKVIAFIHDGTNKLCATGYTMSQKAFVGNEEFVFGQHETAQVSISTIERRAQLDFGPLCNVDPLAKGLESVEARLTDFSQIRFL